MGNKGAFTNISQEIEIVNHYVEIQKFRYSDLFELIWNVDNNLLDCLIPKTLIQPLVENSIFHGICPKDEKGTIRIAVQKDEKGICIEIEDNGIGMEQDKVQFILNGEGKLVSNDSIRHIGVANIRDRIRYLYGEEYGICIESSVDKGTRVILHVPYILNES